MMKHSIFLKSFIACQLFGSLQSGELHNTIQEDAFGKYVIQFNAFLSSYTIWTSSDGKDQQYVFLLSDGTRWMTHCEQDFFAITKAGWAIGDKLCITLTDDSWLAQNTDRNHELTLLQLCNKQEILN